MSSPYVCATCRVRTLLGNGVYSATQRRRWLSRTAIVKQDTLDNLFERTPHRRRESHAPRDRDDDRNQRRTRPQEDGPRGRYSGQILRPQQLLNQLDEPQSPTAYRRLRPQRPSTTPPPRRQPWNEQQDTPSVVQRLPPSLFELRNRLYRWRKHPDEQASIWDSFQHNLNKRHAPDVWKLLGDSSTVRSNLGGWNVKVCKDWLRDLAQIVDRRADELPYAPTPLQALGVWKLFGTERAMWEKSLCVLVSGVFELYAARLEELNSQPGLLEQVLYQLMGSWHLCMSHEHQRKHPEAEDRSSLDPYDILSLHPAPLSWAFLPSPDVLTESIKDRQQTTPLSPTDAINLLIRSKRPSNSQNLDFDYASAAVMTLDLLKAVREGHVQGEHELCVEYEPWMESMEAMLQSVSNRTVPIALEMKMRADDMSKEVKARYSAVLERFNLDRGEDVEYVQTQSGVNSTADHVTTSDVVDRTASEPGLPKTSTSSLPDVQAPIKPAEDASASDRFVYQSIVRCGRAIETQDLRAVDHIRQDVLDFNVRSPNVQLELKLYEHVMLAYLALRSLEPAIEMWKLMLKAGHQPTTKTYTVMIRGSQYMKDVNVMESFWGNMRREGLRPDVHAWTARVYGLFRKGKTDLGMRALSEMGSEWMAAARIAHAREFPAKKKKGQQAVPTTVLPSELLSRYGEDVDGIPRPALYTMNSALTGLAARNSSAIPKVLTWGRSFGIEPDIITYNLLINVSMRESMTDEALSILRRMGDKGIEANSDTWNVLLTSMFEGGFMDGLSPEQQEERIMSFVKALESANATSIDQKGYAILIDRLLKRYDNPQAAQSILAHMAERGVEPTQYHYTILMTSYFQQSPPNFAAIESLWSRISSGTSGYTTPLGSQFYDRMIEGYATHASTLGSTAPVLKFLTRMESEGKKPSWRALECVARALADAREWERLAQIVGKVRGRMREQGVGGTTWGQRDFWTFVISTGLLRGEGVTDANQVMRENMTRGVGARGATRTL